MNKIKLTIISVIAILGFLAFMPSHVYASPASDIVKGGVTDAGGSTAPPLGTQINIVINAILFILGAIAVVMIIIGGVRYATSAGDQSAIKGAKDTILFAVVGLVVAIAAFSIVNFILDRF